MEPRCSRHHAAASGRCIRRASLRREAREWRILREEGIESRRTYVDGTGRDGVPQASIRDLRARPRHGHDLRWRTWIKPYVQSVFIVSFFISPKAINIFVQGTVKWTRGLSLLSLLFDAPPLQSCYASISVYITPLLVCSLVGTSLAPHFVGAQKTSWYRWPG